MASLFDQIDNQLVAALSEWNLYSTLLLLALASLITYTIVTAQDPDIHPMILCRQTQAGFVRNKGESAIYRAPDVAHGGQLRTGLGVKLPSDPPYTAGRDGDLRDIWRRVTGEIPLQPTRGQPQPTTESPKILTVLGKANITEHPIPELTKEISVVGGYIQKHGGSRVAIYLPNSVEFLSTLFATSFFGLTVILIPYNQPHLLVVELLQKTKADVLVAEAGSLPLELLSERLPALSQLIWVVEETSRHMDWTEIPEGLGGKIDVSVWHQLVQDQQDSPSGAFPDLKSNQLGKIVTIWQNQAPDENVIVEFTHGNFVSAISALISAIPMRQRINSSDLFFAADSFTNTYSLCQTLAALFSHASIIINSVAGPGVDLTFAAKNIAPTVVVASPESAVKLHSEASPSVNGGINKMLHHMQNQSLEAGRMPTDSILTQLKGHTSAAIGSTPGRLRLLFIPEKANANTPPLSSQDLCDLRIFTGARVVYALTAAKVAGAVAQTNVFDYRKGSAKNLRSHFGVPLGSLEIKLLDTEFHKTTDESAKGEILVTGPAVSGLLANLGIAATFRDDHTLAFI